MPRAGRGQGGSSAALRSVLASWRLPGQDRGASPATGKYEARQIIGTGSYGHVVEAYDRVNKRLVAIKRVDRIFEDLVDGKRILREISILTSLDSDCVVRMFEICVPDDLGTFSELYLVMEICDSDLKKLLKSPAHLTEDMIRNLIYNTLLGLKYIHSVGIYHRDLKPANCLVNQDCSVKLCDFGLARAITQGPGEGTSWAGEDLGGASRVPQRQLTAHVVTRWYRAPELILLQSNYTEAIDMWSLGCAAGEIYGMLEANIPDTTMRGPLFPGSSCFPLSPRHRDAAAAARRGGERGEEADDTLEKRDQLSTIFGVIGTPSPAEVETLETDEMKRYLLCFARKEPQDLYARFPGSEPEAVDLLIRMLTFSPRSRITVDEALTHPYFRTIRKPELEKAHREGYLFLPFESEPELDEAKLRRYALLEVQKFHPEVSITV